MIASANILQPRLELAVSEPRAQLIPIDELTRLRAQRFIQEAGAVALSSTVATPEGIRPEEGSRYPTCMDALHAAQAGDLEARKVVENNAKTEVWEALMKQIVMRMHLTVDRRGRLGQDGQLLSDVQKNGLLFGSPLLRERTYAEIRNYLLMEHLIRRGDLDAAPEDHTGDRILVVSCFPDDMSEELAGQAGFFRETMACSIQMLYMQDGEVVQESGFLAGRISRDAPRHDKQAICHMLSELGVPLEDIADMSVTELLGRPLLVDKSVDMATLLRLYDEGAGGTFFGLNQPQQDYYQAIQEGQRHLARLKTTVEQVVTVLIARAHEVKTPQGFVRMLHNVAKDIMVDLALGDDSIEANVFHEGAAHIEEARHFLAIGDMESFQKARTAAHATARTTSCPIFENDSEADGGKEDEAIDEKENRARAGTGRIRPGYCRTPNCLTQGKKTLIGECHVCLCCQDLWDHGIDPSTVYVPYEAEESPGETLIASIRSPLIEQTAGRLAIAA